MRLMFGLAVACGLALGAGTAMAQGSAGVLQLDASLLPRPPVVMQNIDRSRTLLIETGAGAAAGIIIVDILSDGMLLAPLGFPTFGALFDAAPLPGAPVPPDPTYTLAQRLLAGVGTAASALAGGYITPRLLDASALNQ